MSTPLPDPFLDRAAWWEAMGLPDLSARPASREPVAAALRCLVNAHHDLYANPPSTAVPPAIQVHVHYQFLRRPEKSPTWVLVAGGVAAPTLPSAQSALVNWRAPFLQRISEWNRDPDKALTDQAVAWLDNTGGLPEARSPSQAGGPPAVRAWLSELVKGFGVHVIESIRAQTVQKDLEAGCPASPQLARPRL